MKNLRGVGLGFDEEGRNGSSEDGENGLRMVWRELRKGGFFMDE